MILQGMATIIVGRHECWHSGKKSYAADRNNGASLALMWHFFGGQTAAICQIAREPFKLGPLLKVICQIRFGRRYPHCQIGLVWVISIFFGV